MARYRQRTTDHDGDGRKGGSLPAGTRFVKGTNDPDNDGKRGGSLPKGDEPMAKEATKKTPPGQAKKADAKPEAEAEAQEVEVIPGDPTTDPIAAGIAVRGY